MTSFREEDPVIPLPGYPHCRLCGSEMDLALAFLQNLEWRGVVLDGKYTLCECCRRSRSDREEDGR